ncbi:MAG: thioesterase family protein [Reyranella sp.]|uniref:thioesterase family protein n=1 Tax=Reyranella sp. TaxID=1929291 RepID=UPI0012227584|nr:thioesterase family protein [Reyranella sp.]TAJ40992.1 MAG: thioesterase family protein [Reyranella sp.]
MEAIYRVDGITAETSAFAGGPWDPRLQHGAAPSSLICWAVERLPSPVPMRVARLTVDLMRPVPVAPLTVETEIVREGRKIQLVSVRLLAGGVEVVRASALRIRVDPQEMPAIAGGPPVELPFPDLCSAPDFFATETPFLRGIEMRVAKGGFRIPGPAAVWYRATRPIIAEGAISPLMRTVIAADFCNGTSSVFDMKDWTFINADLTVSLGREPVGDWILLDAETWVGPDSVGIAAARLADTKGYFGRAVQSVIFEKR